MFQHALNTQPVLILKFRDRETPIPIYANKQVCLILTGHAVDYGVEFVTAFPENLAYYFPAELYHTLKITTFLPDTTIQIFMNGTSVNQSFISIPQVFTVNVSGAEVNQFDVSTKSIRIVSDKNITVLSINKRGDSIQANVVLPTTHLGLEYLVPSHNYTELAVQLNTYNYSVVTDSSIAPMDFSYRLLIINAENVSNSVAVTKKTPEKEESTEIALGPFELTQLPSDAFWFKVSSTAKVAVILTNPCIDTENCRCNLVAHQLRPTTFLGTEFIFPPFDDPVNRLVVTSADSVDLSCGSESKTVAPGSIGLLPYLPALDTGSPSFTTSVPASVRVIHPGIIIDLLPKTLFSSCYLVHTNRQTRAFVILIVETATKDDTHMGIELLSAVISVNWNNMGDTGYSWASVNLNSYRSCIFWHPTSKIAVYVFEYSESLVLYGGPAISVNNEPGKVLLEFLQIIKTIKSNGI